jgi:hypothetical protein
MFVEFVTGISGLGRSSVEHIGSTKWSKFWYSANSGSSFAGVLEPLWFGRLFLYASDSF